MNWLVPSVVAVVTKPWAGRSRTGGPRYQLLYLERLEARIAPSILETTYNNPYYDTSNPDWASNVVQNRTFTDLRSILSGYPRWDWTPILNRNDEYGGGVIGVTGWAIQPQVSDNDNELTHPWGHDFEYYIAPDARFSPLVARSNREPTPGSDYWDAKVAAATLGHPVPGVLGVETDQGLLPGGWPLPDNMRYRPLSNDRVAVFGRWIVDAGHEDFHSEIHPPLMTVTARPQGPTNPDWTTSKVLGNPYLVSQQFIHLDSHQDPRYLNRGTDDGPLIPHLLNEVAKIPFQSLQVEAHPGILARPFSGTQVLTYVVQPPTGRQRSGDQLITSFHFTVRSGVSVSFFDAGPDAVGVRVTLDANTYSQAPLPRRQDATFYEFPWYLSWIWPWSRGVLTDRYDPPVPFSVFDTRSNTVDTDNSQPFPIYGYLNVGWQRQVASHFSIDAPAQVNAGSPFTITVRALDASYNLDPRYRGTVHFTSSDGTATLPADYTFRDSDYGTHVFVNEATLRTSEARTITVSDRSDATITGTVLTVVNPAAASTLVIGVPPETIVGVPTNITVTARDTYGNVATGYRGTVHFASSDARATLPTDYQFTADDHGVHTWPGGLILRTAAGLQTINVIDTGISSIAGRTTLTVNPGAASRLEVTVNQIGIAGTPMDVTVTARDTQGNVATGYRGTVRFTSSPGWTTLPRDHTFSQTDGGWYYWHNELVLRTAGLQTLTVIDTVNPLLTVNIPVLIFPDVASTFLFSGPPPVIRAGEPNNLMVIAMDRFGNRITDYTGTVHFSSTDRSATLPGDYAFEQYGDFGGHIWPEGFTLSRLGAQTITATDTLHPSLSGRLTINVQPGAATRILLLGPSRTAMRQPHNFRVTALDRYGNGATSYLGTVTFSSSDGGVRPDPHTFTPADNGRYTFTAAPSGLSTWTITATDAENSFTSSVRVDVDPATFDPSVTYDVGFAPTSIASGDFNGDGIPDLVAAANDGNVAVLFGNGDGTFQSPVRSNIGPFVGSVKVADFNRDGKADLAVAREIGYVTVLFGDGAGIFPSSEDVPIGSLISSVEVGDFNGDGLPDLVVAFTDFPVGFRTYHLVGVFLNNPNRPGTFQGYYVDHLLHDQDDVVWGTVVVGHFHNTQALDFAVVYYLPSSSLDPFYTELEVDTFLGDGDGRFRATAGGRWRNIGLSSPAVGDLNGDGIDDVLVAITTFESSGLGLMLNNGDGTFTLNVANYDSNPLFVAVGDFQGNGRLDLVTWTSSNGPYDDGGAVQLFLNDGDTWQPPVNYGVGIGSTSAVAADFNRDGSLDLAVANGGSQDISVLLNLAGRQSPRKSPPGSRHGPRDAVDSTLAALAAPFHPSPPTTNPPTTLPQPAPALPPETAYVEQLFAASAEQLRRVSSPAAGPQVPSEGEDWWDVVWLDALFSYGTLPLG